MKGLLSLSFLAIIAVSSAQAMGGKSRKKKVEKDTIVKSNLVHNFYTEKGTLQDIEAAADPKAYLNKILNSNHKVSEDKADEIVESCEGVEKCLSPKKYSYKHASTYFFGDIHFDQYADGTFYIKDIYCLKEYSSQDFPSDKSIGPNLIPEHTILNTEHVWPKYRFLRNETDLPKKERETHPEFSWKEGDLHILYPSNSSDNSLRGNYEFGEVEKSTKTTSCDDTKLGHIKLADGTLSSDVYFEPPAESKGNVARVLFYFSTRYNVPIHPAEEAFIRQWHKADPVDEMEIRRNKKIYELQNVRNPFIDMPELADSIKDF